MRVFFFLCTKLVFFVLLLGRGNRVSPFNVAGSYVGSFLVFLSPKLVFFVLLLGRGNK